MSEPSHTECASVNKSAVFGDLAGKPSYKEQKKTQQASNSRQIQIILKHSRTRRDALLRHWLATINVGAERALHGSSKPE